MTAAEKDPREIVNCACPRIGGASCAEARHGFADPDGYECPCHCHEIYEARLFEMADNSEPEDEDEDEDEQTE